MTLHCSLFIFNSYTVHSSSINLSIIEMTTSPSLTMMEDTAQSTISTVMINDLMLIMFYFTIDTIVTVLVSSITVLLVMVIITSLVTQLSSFV